MMKNTNEYLDIHFYMCAAVRTLLDLMIKLKLPSKVAGALRFDLNPYTGGQGPFANIKNSVINIAEHEVV